MRFNTLLTIWAVIAMLDALLAIFAPGPVVNAFWPPHRIGPEVYLFVRMWGACLLVLSVMAWAAKSLREATPRRLFALGFFIYHLIGMMTFLVDGLSRGWTPAGIIIVVAHGLFAMGFGYFRFGRSASLEAGWRHPVLRPGSA